jgi:integrase
LPTAVLQKAGQSCLVWNAGNERAIWEFQSYLGRYHPRMIDAVSASIRHLESCLDRKSFHRLSARDIDRFRKRLLELGDQEKQGPLTRSTVCHRASHNRMFLGWLVRQNGFRRLNPLLYQCMDLPKAASAAILQPLPKAYPTLEEARSMISCASTRTMVERRDRANVALAFLSALRAGPLATLRLGAVDVATALARVDARKARAKNGKSYQLSWFPVGDAFGTVVTEWINEPVKLGARPEDPLFPPDAALADAALERLRAADGSGLGDMQPWASEEPIRRAFGRLCRTARLPAFTPHSARHCVKALGDTLCRTEEALEAWSKNLSHFHRQITASHHA